MPLVIIFAVLALLKLTVWLTMPVWVLILPLIPLIILYGIAFLVLVFSLLVGLIAMFVALFK